MIARVLTLVAVCLAWPAHAVPPKLHYYVVVLPVVDPDGQETPFTVELHDLFVDALTRRGDVTLERPAWLPGDPEQMRVELIKHAMKAYEGHVKIVAIRRTVSEPEPKKRSLTVRLELQLLGNTLPDRELKIGGSGEASTTVALADNADVERVTTRLLHRLARPALDEAIKATIEKIDAVAQREKKQP